MQTPEGINWKRAEEEKQRKQKEEWELKLRASEEKNAREKWTRYYESKTMIEISCMSGGEFERFLAHLFTRMGFTEVSLTPINDQGGDITCRDVVEN